jgi:ATP-binding cassette, subfamily B, bacterial
MIVLGYTAQLFKPLRTFTKQIGKLSDSLASVERSFEMLDQEPEVTDAPDALPLDHAMGEIEFSEVSFSYTKGSPVLENVSFHIDPGSTIGIAGRTGSGKSTLLSLMMRFYEPDSGLIKFEGRDIRDFKIADVRSQFALVLQDPVLFSTTIADNIAYGRPDATMDEIVAAAKAANAHTFISKMPDGYNSPVGERGMKLSGGERQRVSLARAFLKNGSVLVLDEPTSSVDIQTEAEIMEAMERLMKGRTTLTIAHRLQTLKNCDMILLVDRGRVRVVEPDNLVDLMTEVAMEVHDEPEPNQNHIDLSERATGPRK